MLASIPSKLVLIKGEDKTKDISKIRNIKYSGKTEITYKSGKTYSYNSSNVLVYECSKESNLPNASIVSVEGTAYVGIVRIQEFGPYARLVRNNGSYLTVIKSSMQIEQKDDNGYGISDGFSYLKELSDYIGIKVAGTNILAQNYARIGEIKKDSILYGYLNGIQPASRRSNSNPIIYPFGFNLSQKNAVENAMNNRVSIIEGPPGTGKTQTILNIISNAILRNESVAVVSNNNTAIINVYEKLKKNGIEFVAAVLGNRDNKLEFIETQQTELPVVSSWENSALDRIKQIKHLAQQQTNLDRNLDIKNELSSLQAQYDEINKEEHYYSSTVSSDNQCEVGFKKNLRADSIMRFIAEYEYVINNSIKIGVIHKIKWYFAYGITNFAFLNFDSAAIINYCEKRFYDTKRQELSKLIAKQETALADYNFENKMNVYSLESMNVLKSVLYDKYKSGKRALYDATDLRKNSEQFIKDYPVILSTTYSLRTSLGRNHIYDYVIIDEASQVDIATGALALSCAKNVVVVGDLKQLPNVVDRDTRLIGDTLFAKYDLNEVYDFTKHSILSSLISVFDKAPRVLLKEHYRCAPEIINFCNKSFYDGSLLVLTDGKRQRTPMVVYRTVAGNHARNHMNQRQIDVIKDEVLPNIQLNNGETIGIVTPYRNQAKALQQAFIGTGIKADTVDKFQGQERNIMIFSTVDNEIGEFASDPNRLNVAVSRAIDQFIVVTDGNENDKTSPIHDLIGYINYNNYEIVDSEITSIFDNLYKGYEQARRKIIEKYGKVSQFDSENLMYSLIKEVLSQTEYTKYDVKMHIPLRHFIRDKSKLGGRELEFAENINSHLDFVIYSKLDYSPALVIEVDGFRYHAANQTQLGRDKIKDEIMRKYNIPMIRLSTIGSNEKDRLITELEKLM